MTVWALATSCEPTMLTPVMTTRMRAAKIFAQVGFPSANSALA